MRDALLCLHVNLQVSLHVSLQVNLQVVVGALPNSYTSVTYNITPLLVCLGSCLRRLFPVTQMLVPTLVLQIPPILLGILTVYGPLVLGEPCNSLVRSFTLPIPAYYRSVLRAVKNYLFADSVTG